jgi:heme ABC exporter ATP-binding subunit CcmA
MNSTAVTAPLLETRGLTRYYGYRPALRGVDLSVAAGQMICLLGPNGAGKSTLLGTLCAPRRPDEGDIHFRGRPVTTDRERRAYLAEVGTLGHEPGLLYDLTARENLAFFQGLYVRRGDAGRIDALLKRTGLADRAGDLVRTFSRGLKQRLGLCRVFLSDPALVYLDEPLTGLDREGTRVLLGLLEEHLARGGSALAATHSEAAFRDLAHRFIYLRNGSLVADIPRERYNETSRAKAEALLYGAS